MLCFLRRGNGIRGTDMCRRYSMKVYIGGEGNLGIINRAKWRIHYYRYKTIIGRKLRARTEKGREVEALLGCVVLNRFTELGRCRSEQVA